MKKIICKHCNEQRMYEVKTIGEIKYFHCSACGKSIYPQENLKEVSNKELVDEIFNRLNIMGNENAFGQALQDALCGYQHRTLQQSFWGMIKKIACHYSKEMENSYDDRNEASVKFCKMINDNAEDHYLPFI